jgi:hypothetical protein
VNVRTTGNTGAFTRLAAKLQGLGTITTAQVRPLLERWERILVEDNRKGVLAGLDKYGMPMPPLGYRDGTGARTRSRARNSFEFGTINRASAAEKNRAFLGRHGRGKGQVRFNNLKGSQYRRQTGPRLAPRRDASRVITNLVTESGQDGPRRFTVTALWRRVVTKKGKPFLIYHFTGAGKNPKYDLRGVRAWGLDRAREALRDWITALSGSL